MEILCESWLRRNLRCTSETNEGYKVGLWETEEGLELAPF